MAPQTPIRIGPVPYLNVEPLVWALDSSTEPIELIPATPRTLATLLAQGDVDVGLIPVAEVIRTGRWPVVPGISIACDGPVQSTILVSKTPLPQIRTILLDRSSMTSILLAQLMLRELYGIAPEAELSKQSLRVDHDFAGDPHDAFVVIGNEALRIGPRALPHFLDLGEAWKSLTGLPFVFAVWAVAESGRSRAAEITRILTEAAVRGLHNLETVCAAGAERHNLPYDLVRRYLTEAVRYGLGPHEQRAVSEFGRRLVARGLLDTARPLAFAVGESQPVALKDSG